MSEQTTFEDLLRRVRGGDQGAAAELVRQYEPTIRRVARVRLLDTRLRRLLEAMEKLTKGLNRFSTAGGIALGAYQAAKPYAPAEA